MIVTEREASIRHCGQMVRTLRKNHLHAINADAHRELRKMLESSCIRRAWFVDGKLAAMAGVTGTAIGPDGFLWCAITDEVSKYPNLVARKALKFVREVMATRHSVSTMILSGDKTSVGFAYFLGFMVKQKAVDRGVPVLMMTLPIKKVA